MDKIVDNLLSLENRKNDLECEKAIMILSNYGDDLVKCISIIPNLELDSFSDNANDIVDNLKEAAIHFQTLSEAEMKEEEVLKLGYKLLDTILFVQEEGYTEPSWKHVTELSRHIVEYLNSCDAWDEFTKYHVGAKKSLDELTQDVVFSDPLDQYQTLLQRGFSELSDITLRDQQDEIKRLVEYDLEYYSLTGILPDRSYQFNDKESILRDASLSILEDTKTDETLNLSDQLEEIKQGKREKALKELDKILFP